MPFLRVELERASEVLGETLLQWTVGEGDPSVSHSRSPVSPSTRVTELRGVHTKGPKRTSSWNVCLMALESDWVSTWHW